AGPLALLRVPPDVALALRPGLAVRICGGTVVEDAAVVRPGPAPLLRHPILLGVRLAPGDLVDLILVAAGVDPAAARRGAVVGEVQVAGQRAVVHEVDAADLPHHRPGAGIVVRPV